MCYISWSCSWCKFWVLLWGFSQAVIFLLYDCWLEEKRGGMWSFCIFSHWFAYWIYCVGAVTYFSMAGKGPFLLRLSYDLSGGIYKVLLARERVLPLSLLRFVFNCVWDGGDCVWLKFYDASCGTTGDLERGGSVLGGRLCASRRASHFWRLPGRISETIVSLLVAK